MACGNYGCITKNKSSAISAFGAMSIVIFALGLLICSHEHSGLSEEPLKLYKNHQNVPANCTHTSVTNSDKNSVLNSTRDLICTSTRYLKNSNEDIIQIGRHKAALVASIVFCVLGIIFGILLMHAPKSQNKKFCVAWITFASCTALIMFILGIYIGAIQGPYQQIFEVSDATNFSGKLGNVTSELPQKEITSPPEIITSSSAATTSTTIIPSPVIPVATISSPAATNATQEKETPDSTTKGSGSEAKSGSPKNSDSTPNSSGPTDKSRQQRSISEKDHFSVYQKYELVIPRSFPLSAIYLLNVWPFLLWSVVATYLSIDGIAAGRDE